MIPNPDGLELICSVKGQLDSGTMNLTVLGQVSIERVAAGTYDLTLAQVILGIDIGNAPDARDIVVMGMSANVPTALVDINFEKISDSVLRFFINVNGTPYDNSFSFSLYRMAGQSRSEVVVGPPLPIPPIPSSTTLQQAYDNSVGIPVNIQLAVARGGIRILDIAGLTTSPFQILSSLSALDSFAVTRSFVGGGDAIMLTMAVGTTGNAINISESGTGRPIQITHGSGTNSSIRIDRSPGVVTAGAGLDIIYGANTTGTPIVATTAGAGGTAVLSNSGSSNTLNIGASGTGATLLATHTGTSTVPYFFGQSTNTSGIMMQFSRTPTVATGGTIFRISSNPSFTGIDFELLMGGTSDAGVNLVMRGSGEGMGLFDQVPNTHTGTALRIQHSITGSTGILLQLTKIPAGATAGNIINITVGALASGITLNIAHAGTGNIISITGTAGAFALALLPGGQLQHANGSAAAPSISFNSSPTTGFIRSAADIIGVVTAATERFQFTNTGTGEFIPPADNAGSVGSAARRFALVRAVTITSGDIAFEDEQCPRCKKEFNSGEEIILKIYKVGKDEKGKRISYSVPMHRECGVLN